MSKHKYTSFDYPFKGVPKEESYSYLRLPYLGTKGTKILFVLDYVPKEDLHTGRLLSGATGELLESLINVAQRVMLRRKEDIQYLAVNYNAYRTVGKSAEYQTEAHAAFTKRIETLVGRYKPDVIVTFGYGPSASLITDKMSLSKNNLTNWYGVPCAETIGKHKCLVVPSISLNTIVNGDSGAASMIGYIAQNIANAILKRIQWGIDDKVVKAHKSILIDGVKKFDKMLDMLAEQKFVAVDTEANSLARVTNTLLTVQFAKCEKYGYVVPIAHKDTPFMASELKYIKKRLRAFFEGETKNELHIYANAQFDLSLLRDQLGCEFMGVNAWDIFAGEYCADENMKCLTATTGGYYHSLGNLSTQFGTDCYLISEFSKSDRKNISTTDLNDALVKYMTNDVVVPWMIFHKQRERAVHHEHKLYNTLVGDQYSDLVHGFSKMESTGSGVDVQYLFHLRTPASPIEAVIKEMQAKLFSSDAVKAVNRRLLKNTGAQEKVGGWATNMGETNLFSLSTHEHKRALFFDVLGLKPIEVGKDGKTGKLDKAFQEKYKDVPEVKMYTALGKAEKLRNAYVKNFLALLSSNADFRSDYRIRPNYNYLKVVTGRTSASDPNLQQIPSRSELGKHIKRLFIARNGHLYVKVDYRVHEVRGWGLISFDRGIAAVFEKAKEIRDAYRLRPSAELAKRLKSEADIHIVNAMYFFSKTIEQFTKDPDLAKELRNAVKGVIFGLIYQMSLKSLAKTLNQTEDFTKNLVKNFNKRFPRGMKWIEDCKKFAQTNGFYENPLGFRRHLWGYFLPLSAQNGKRIHSEMDRRAVNSPIQGMCAQFAAIGMRMIDRNVFNLGRKLKRKVSILVNNSVHDSVECEASYRDFIKALSLIETSLTVDVREEVYRRVGFEFVVDLEIDTEVGSTLANCKGWDCSLLGLANIVKSSVEFQKNDLGYELDVQDTLDEVFGQYDDYAPWMVKQAKLLSKETLKEFPDEIRPHILKLRKLNANA